MTKTKTKFYFTFGFGHEHENGYHVIESDCWSNARGEMIRRFGTKWAFQYESAEAAGVEKFHLHEVFWTEETENEK